MFRQCPAHTKNQTTKASSASKKSIDFPTVKRGRKEKAKPTDSIFTYSQYGALQTRSLRTVVDAATLATRECRRLREPWPMFCSDFSKPHSKCMRNSLFDWSELSALYTKYIRKATSLSLLKELRLNRLFGTQQIQIFIEKKQGKEF
uniref:Uncharacterized protein n=1 Tax=Caenorhabditis japonica TaxID=281687 RepID=A0A8R1EQU0_CAEJA